MSHLIQHSFIQQILIEELLCTRFCVGTYPRYRTKYACFLTVRSYQCNAGPEGGPSFWTVQLGHFEEQQTSLYTGTAFHLKGSGSLGDSSHKSSTTRLSLSPLMASRMQTEFWFCVGKHAEQPSLTTLSLAPPLCFAS